ncbi:MAG: diacylglycerol kinase family protein [Thermoleophilia bacterium]
MAGFLLINPRSGSGSPDAEELRRAAEAKGVRVHVLGEEDDPAELARGAEADALGMAGGDGSLAAVAEAAIDRGLPFVCIPFGTRNHFARDVGLDRDDPLGALEAFGGRERTIDVGSVNGRVFLNNVSLGAYAELVHRRESHRRRRAALARVRALWMTARDRHGLRARVEGREVEARVIFVGNNAYELDVFNVGERERLDEGVLHLYTLEGWLPSAWNDSKGETFTVETPDSKVDAAIDGEPVELESPLRFEVRPRALRVLLPAPQE